MYLVIRADSSSTIGIGHVTRCLALAQTWQERGGKAVLIGYCESDMLRQRVQEAGIELIPLNRPQAHVSDFGRVAPILDEFRRIGSGAVVWVVLDGYHFDTVYQGAVREAGLPLLVIDDMNHLPYYHADVLLNQNIHAQSLSYNCSLNTTLLLGTHYALLRPEFRRSKPSKHDDQHVGIRLLVTMGGADPPNATLKIVQALTSLNMPDLQLALVAGPANPHKEAIERALKRLPVSDYRLFDAVNNMAELMRWANVAVSAGGSTCWELAAMGVPFLTVVLAENQRLIADGLASAGIAVNLGRIELLAVEEIARVLLVVIRDLDRRKEMGRRGQVLIDGNGTERVTDTLLGLA